MEYETERILSASIMINGESMLVPSPWYQLEFLNNMNHDLGHEDFSIRDAEIVVESSTHDGPINEAIDAFVEMSDQVNGLRSIILRDLPADTQFDSHLLTRLVKKCLNIE